MNSLQALGICVTISIATSLILLGAISRPLTAFIGKLCPDSESNGFWLRFTIVMLFLAPLFFTVTFSIPHRSLLIGLEAGDLIQPAVTSTLIGASFAMIGMGFWVSALARRSLSRPH